MTNSAIRILLATWGLIVILMVLPRVAQGAPKVTVSVAQGYLVLLKDGDPNPGPSSTRFGVGIGLPVTPAMGMSLTVGFTTPNDLFKPSPRTILGASLKLTDELSLAGGILGQCNYGYGGSDTTYLVGASAGPSLKIGNGLALGLQLGGAKTLGPLGLWSLLIQPGITFFF